MSADQAIVDTVAERWFARALDSYSLAVRASLAGDQDPFRNPAGHALRSSLRILAAELLENMDSAAVAQALDAVVRLRAVQEIAPSQAVQFVLELRSIAAETPAIDSPILQERIDALALLAFDQYMSCREKIFELRLKEFRSMHPAGVMP